jgi:hypothetical protein
LFLNEVTSSSFSFRSPIKYFPSFEKKASIPEMGPFFRIVMIGNRVVRFYEKTNQSDLGRKALFAIQLDLLQ